MLLLWFCCSCCFVLVGFCFVVVWLLLLLLLLLFHCSTLFWVHCCCCYSCFFVVVVVSVVLCCCWVAVSKTGLGKNEKTGSSLETKKSFRSGKIASDPKIGSDGFCNQIRSDELNNQSEVDMSANEKGSDLKIRSPI